MGFLDFPKLDLYEIHSGARQAYDCGKEIWTPWISWPNKPCNDSSLLPLLIRRLMENWIITISTPRLAGKHDSDALIEKSCSTHGACVRRVMNQETFWPCSSLIRSGEKNERSNEARATRKSIKVLWKPRNRSYGKLITACTHYLCKSNQGRRSESEWMLV